MLPGEDGGNFWVELNIIERKITSLSVAPTAAANIVSVAMCTYVDGCYNTELDLDVLRIARSPKLNPPMRNWVHARDADTSGPATTWNGPASMQYNVADFSPQYASDGFVVHAAQHHVFASLDRGLTWRRSTQLAAIPATAPLKGPHARISQLIVAGSSGATPLVFVAGINYGVMVSNDRAQTFTRVWGPFSNTLYTLALSAGFESDRTMVVTTSGVTNAIAPERKCKVSDTRIHITRDGGLTWNLLPRDTAFDSWEWLALSPNFAVDNVMVATKSTIAAPCNVTASDRSHADIHTGEMRLSTDAGQSWEHVGNQHPYAASWRDAGFGRGGASLAPTFATDGAMVASLQESGLVRGHLNTTSGTLDEVEYRAGGGGDDTPPFAFAHPILVRSGLQRSLGSLVAYSPHYAADSVVLGASFSTLMVSFNKGRDWQAAITLVPMSMSCVAVGCRVCAVHNRSRCKTCTDGYHLVATVVKADEMTWPVNGAAAYAAGTCHKAPTAVQCGAGFAVKSDGSCGVARVAPKSTTPTHTNTAEEPKTEFAWVGRCCRVQKGALYPEGVARGRSATRVLSAKTLGQCKRACARNPVCHGISFMSSGQTYCSTFSVPVYGVNTCTSSKRCFSATRSSIVAATSPTTTKPGPDAPTTVAQPTEPSTTTAPDTSAPTTSTAQHSAATTTATASIAARISESAGTYTPSAADCNGVNPVCAQMPLVLCSRPEATDLPPACRSMCKLCTKDESAGFLKPSGPQLAIAAAHASVVIKTRAPPSRTSVNTVQVHSTPGMVANTGEPCGGKEKPLKGSFCGRGGTRCNRGYTCDIHPTDVWAVCCPDETAEVTATTPLPALSAVGKGAVDTSPCLGDVRDFATARQGRRGQKLQGRGWFVSGRVFHNGKFFTSNVSDCARTCAADSRCYGFASQQGGFCELYTRAGAASETVVQAANWDLHLKREACLSSQASTGSCAAGESGVTDAFARAEMRSNGDTLKGMVTAHASLRGWPPAISGNRHRCTVACYTDLACAAFMHNGTTCQQYDAAVIITVPAAKDRWPGLFRATGCPSALQPNSRTSGGTSTNGTMPAGDAMAVSLQQCNAQTCRAPEQARRMRRRGLRVRSPNVTVTSATNHTLTLAHSFLALAQVLVPLVP